MSVATAVPKPLDAATLARRPVWAALGELYLDTDTRPDVPRIACVLADSGLGEAELRHLWHEEVTPALAFNLRLVAGEWGGFDPDWLEQQIVRRQAAIARFGNRPTFTRWLRQVWPNRGWPNELQPAFEAVLRLRGELLKLPDAQWDDRAEAWHWAARLYFWPDWPGFTGPSQRPAHDVVTALEPLLRPLLTPGECRRLPPARRLAHVLGQLEGRHVH